MPVIGFSVKSIEANKSVDNAAQITANSTPKITDVKEIDVHSLDKKALGLSFEFVTDYAPNVGSIKLSGEVIYLVENNKKILSDWEKNKRLPDFDSVEVLNYLFRRCLLKVVNLADDLQLPPPVQFPIVRMKEPERGPNKSEASAA